MEKNKLYELFSLKEVPSENNNFSVINYHGCINLINERNQINLASYENNKPILNVCNQKIKDCFFNFVLYEYFSGKLNTGFHPLYDIDASDLKTIASLIYSEVVNYCYCEEKLLQYINPIAIGYIFNSNVISSIEKCEYTGRKNGPFFEVIQCEINLDTCTLSDIECAIIELQENNILNITDTFELNSSELEDARHKYIRFVEVFKQFYSKFDDLSETVIPTVRNTFLYEQDGIYYLALLKNVKCEYNYIVTHMVEGATSTSELLSPDQILRIISPSIFLDYREIIDQSSIKFKPPYNMTDSRLNAKLFRQLRPSPELLQYTNFADLAFENKNVQNSFDTSMLDLKKAYHNNIIGPFGKCHPLINTPSIGVGDIMK